jgi:MFS family permease
MTTERDTSDNDASDSSPHQQVRRGTARAALQSRDFRVMWMSNIGSSIGGWMQNVVLPAYVYARTGRASIVGIFIFAQLGPMLFLSLPGGVIADKVDRRTWLVAMQSVQLVFSVFLGISAALDASIALLFLMQLGVGIGNALSAPAYSAVLPSLVPPEDLPGTISLSSAAINGSRVAGPIIAAILSSWGVSPAQVFFINAATYLAVIGALFRVAIPKATPTKEQGWQSFTLGIRTVRERPVLSRILLSMFTFSLISLPYVGLFPAVADKNFGIDGGSAMYKWLYAVWGLGAMFGALAVGTVLADHDKRRLARQGFFVFAILLTAFAISRTPLLAFVTGFFLGMAYFATTTALMTVLQSRLELEVRARVLSLWFMAFGGTVPLGNMLFGPVMDSIGSRPVLLMGAAWSLLLAWWCNTEKIENTFERSHA